jgi:branched-subunit amino acid permease
MRVDRILPWYYGATVLFLLLDYAFGLNVRLAFLDALPTAKLAYYGICFVCFALMLWRPSWATLIGTFESLVTLVALILAMAIRIMVPNDSISGNHQLRYRRECGISGLGEGFEAA